MAVRNRAREMIPRDSVTRAQFALSFEAKCATSEDVVACAAGVGLSYAVRLRADQFSSRTARSSQQFPWR